MKHYLIMITVLLTALLTGCSDNGQQKVWLESDPYFKVDKIFNSERFPNIVVTKAGTLLATWGRNKVIARRSEDGGKSWGPEILIAEKGLHSGGTTVDETSGRIFVFFEEEHPPAPLHVHISDDDGLTWKEQSIKIAPDKNGNVPSMCMNEHGTTLKYGENAGRLIRPSRYYAGGNDRSEWPNHYTNAIYSDDGGATWKTSDPFPANGTGEAALLELSDGTIYYNSRRHLSTDGMNPKMRHIAWSSDGGATWENLSVSEELPDGNQYRDYGLMGGLTRIPLDDYDILLYSNIIATTEEEGRSNGHVWVSFNGGKTWLVKRLIDKGSFAYSSMIAGRPGTPGEGRIFLLYESDGGAKVAGFNLSWLLDGKDISEFLHVE